MNLRSTAAGALRRLAARPLSRSDGNLVGRVHPYRRMMFFLMPGRNESIVHYDDYVRVDALLDYVRRANDVLDTEVDLIHCLVAATGMAFHVQPKMNQFVIGRRLYHRNHSAVTFSMKRERQNCEAELSAVKVRIDDPSESFPSICERINTRIDHERSGETTRSDVELAFLNRLPRPILEPAVQAVRWLDSNNLLPAAYIDADPLHTGIVIANLGSLGMRAAYHHLYEYGTCSLFLMVGAVEDRPVCRDGDVVVEKTLHLRWAYDERIDDGLTSKSGVAEVRERLENPELAFGALPSRGPLPRAVHA